jgi:hypothetical protein
VQVLLLIKVGLCKPLTIVKDHSNAAISAVKNQLCEIAALYGRMANHFD